MADELEAPVDSRDPFSPKNAPAVSLVVQMRIYDALMALLQSTDVEAHDELNALHESGKLAWSLPWIDLTEGQADERGGNEDGD